MLPRLLLLPSIALVMLGCQEPTQPTDLTGTRTMTVEVRRSNGTPIPDATIVWQRYTGVNAPVNGVDRTGEDGFANVVISDVATSRDSIHMSVNLPNVDPFIGVGPTEFSTSICTDTLISLSFVPLTTCGATNVADTIILEACPEAGNAVSQSCRFYPTDCPPGLVFTAVDSTSDEISILPANAGTTASTLEVCAVFQPQSGSEADRVFTTVIQGRQPTGGIAQITVNLTVIGRINCEPCPCPALQPVVDTTSSVCVAQSTAFTIPLAAAGIIPPMGQDCVVELFVNSISTPNQVDILSGDQITVRGEQTLPDLEIEVNAVQPGELACRITYAVRTRRLTDGHVEDCGPFTVDLVIPVVDGACRLEPQLIDTLDKCVFNDFSTSDTLYLVNDGDCDATFDVWVSGPFRAEPRGAIVVPPRERRPVVITLTANKDTWDANPQAPFGPKGTKSFTGILSVGGCVAKSYDLAGDGYVQCSAFKFQCLREYRPDNFPSVYAESIELVEDRTNITYQNDNQTFKRYDLWFADIVDVGGGTYEATMGSGDPDNNYSAGRYFRVASGFFVNPGESICDTYPASATTDCTNAKANPTQGSETITGVRAGDVILFVKNNSECALIWVQKIDLDRAGGNALPAACIEICYPMFTLP